VGEEGMIETTIKEMQEDAKNYLRGFRRAEDNFIEIADVTAFHWTANLIASAVRAGYEARDREVRALLDKYYVYADENGYSMGDDTHNQFIEEMRSQLDLFTHPPQ